VGYNTSLAVINKGWKEDRVRRVEIWLHVFSNSFWLITGVVGIIFEIFSNAALFNCWVAPSLYDCHQTGEPCVQGSIPDVFQWAFDYGPIFVLIVAVTYLMVLVYIGVLRIEKKCEKYVFGRENSQDKKKRERSKQVATHGMWVVSSSLLPHVDIPCLVPARCHYCLNACACSSHPYRLLHSLSGVVSTLSFTYVRGTYVT
jgi:hypothetical protein